MADSAQTIANAISGEEAAPEETEETQDEAVEPEETEEVETPEDTPEDELPENIKAILSKNRKSLREAEARATAAEKALAAKEAPENKDESAPADDKFKTLFVNAAAKSALVEAGLSTGTDRFLKMLDLSSIEVDEDGNVSGLDDQIESLKEDFKDLIAPKAPAKKPSVKVDGAGRRETPAVPKTSAELLAERFKK